LAPINLSYVDYLWLNPPLTTLFLMLSIYLLLEERYDISAFSLALSIGFKQTSLFVFPIILFYVVKKLSRKKALRYFLIVVSICLAFSIPYIFAASKLYILSVLRLPLNWNLWGKLPDNYFQLSISLPPGQTIETVNTSTLGFYDLKAMKYAGLNSPISLFLPVFVYLLPELSPNTYSIVSYAFTVLLVATYIILLYKTYKREQFSEKGLVRYTLYSLLIFFTLYPIYKYYVAGVTPQLSLFVNNKRNAIVFIAINFALLLVPRIFTSYMALLALIWLLRTT
jgi:predicted membrane-bound dolichyl-phosphate-mannose-protein mannosyltransferase